MRRCQSPRITSGKSPANTAVRIPICSTQWKRSRSVGAEEVMRVKRALPIFWAAYERFIVIS
jgi:hypothetical protein